MHAGSASPSLHRCAIGELSDAPGQAKVKTWNARSLRARSDFLDFPPDGTAMQQPPPMVESTFVQTLTNFFQDWFALVPALVVVAYFLIGLAVFALRSLIFGRYHDQEMENRGSSLLVGMWIRLYFVWLMRPVWFLVRISGIPATSITTLSVILACASGAAIAGGRFALGGWLYIASAICDFLDGRLARASGTSSKAGAALDSVLDRYADSAILVGLAWYYRSSWVLFVTLLAIVGTLMVPYVRARGEGLGFSLKEVGLMQRPERVVYLGVSVALSPILEKLLDPANPRPSMRLAIAGVILIAVLTQITSFQRLGNLLEGLSDKNLAGSPSKRRWETLRFIVASIFATILDFGLVLTLIVWTDSPVWVATAIACTGGGMFNYSLHRLWVPSSEGLGVPRSARYLFVSATSAGLNAGGVAILVGMPQLHWAVAWAVVRLVVFAAWNYPLQRGYVFGSPTPIPQPTKQPVPPVAQPDP